MTFPHIYYECVIGMYLAPVIEMAKLHMLDVPIDCEGSRIYMEKKMRFMWNKRYIRISRVCSTYL